MPKKKTTKRSTTAKRTTTKRATTAKRAPAKRKTASKATTGKTTTRKTTASKAAPKLVTTAIRGRMTKTELYDEIAKSTELTKKQVSHVIDSLANVIHRSIKKGGAGQFVLPGLLKVGVKRKPATKARKGINPFTGEETTFKAKPARNVVKISPLKKVKDMV